MLDYIAFGVALWVALDLFIVLLLWLVRPRRSRVPTTPAVMRVSPRPSPLAETQHRDAN